MLFILISAFGSTATAQYQEEQLRQNLKQDYFSVGVLMQSRARYSIRNTGFQGGRTFQVPNVRIGVSGNLDNNFYYNALSNLVQQPALLDAYIGWRRSDALSIQGGAMKPRMSADFIPNPVSHDFVDRSRLLGMLGVRREIGIAALGELGSLSYYTGIFNGTGVQINDNNVFFVLARLETALPLANDAATLGVNASYGEVTQSPPGLIGSVDRTIVGADVRYDDQSFLLAAEYLLGSYSSVNINNSATLHGYYLTTGYYVADDILGLIRWQQWMHSEIDALEGSQITLGVKKFATSVVSIETNFDIYFPGTGEDAQYGLTLNANVLF
ncbi:MAG: hypothetical protein WD097_10310 [Balneolales bacterium]